MYISTRGNFKAVTASQAIKLGMVPEGGLFVPKTIPTLSLAELQESNNLAYQELAQKILALYLDDYTKDEIRNCVSKAYNTESFANEKITPLHKLNNNTYILELWHGPTAAFKDLALQILPHLLVLAAKKNDSEKEIVILVATSGDTGKAALEGFKNVSGIKIIVFYPYQKVSKVQELQMSTTDGNNTYVIAVKGNFDDCQSAVKEIFGSKEFKAELFNKGFELSSANSINWGRLLPQIVYYFASYLNLLQREEISNGEKINFVVPTGNFGNILAGWYAYKMGLPVNKFICASNENKVLTDFFNTGIYDKRREFKQTNSPSMDILISSNLERFLFEITNHSAEKINKWMEDLNTIGEFQVDDNTKNAFDIIMAAGYANEEETLHIIKETFEQDGYTLDTHTAVALKVYKDYVKKTGDLTKTIIDSTASPFKFNKSVLQAIRGNVSIVAKDEFLILKELSNISGLSVHHGLKDLDKKAVLHDTVCEREEISQIIEGILKTR